jgi:hypothetical protein
MRLILSTLVVGVVLFLLGWLLYGILFMDMYKQYFGEFMRPEYDMKIWAYAVANFSQAFFMYIIYSKGYKGGSPFLEGLKFGILISLFMGIPYMFMTWGGMRVSYQGVVFDAILFMILITIAGVLTGIIHGKKDTVPVTGN